MKERLKVEHLSVSFFTDEGEVQAVRDVSFSLKAGVFFNFAKVSSFNSVL